jgi:hypothetical protein
MRYNSVMHDADIQEEMPVPEHLTSSKISSREWVILFILIGGIDVIQLLLDLLVVGVAINRAIDVGVGMLFPLYLEIRGVSMVNTKRLVALAGTFTGEMIPAIDSLPLWTLDLVYVRSTVKIEEALAKIKLKKEWDDHKDQRARERALAEEHEEQERAEIEEAQTEEEGKDQIIRPDFNSRPADLPQKEEIDFRAAA